MNKFWECNSSGVPRGQAYGRRVGSIIFKKMLAVFISVLELDISNSFFKAHTDKEKHSMADCNHTYTQTGRLPFFVFPFLSCLLFSNHLK